MEARREEGSEGADGNWVDVLFRRAGRWEENAASAGRRRRRCMRCCGRNESAASFGMSCVWWVCGGGGCAVVMVQVRALFLASERREACLGYANAGRRPQDGHGVRHTHLREARLGSEQASTSSPRPPHHIHAPHQIPHYFVLVVSRRVRRERKGGCL